tara:strand:+ start:4824 stop:6260 length:1437 start_codon:yes stop_codon:yes gene_type:complete
MAFLQRTMNRGSVSTGYDIDNSVKFEDANDEYFTRTNASGTNDKTFTVSFWCKRSKLGGTQELWDGGVHSEAVRIGFGLSSDELWLDIGKTAQYRSTTTQQFRDTSAWYHIVWKVDTTQSTEADRFRVYVNGAEITDWASRQYPPQNFETAVYSGTLARIGSYDSTYHGFSGYMAEFNYLDGLAVAPTEFGEYDDDSGIWIPKEYTGSYPGQSAYLDFKTASDLGANAKGDDTNWTKVNLTAADQSTDTPTNNFCTLNALFTGFNSSVQLPTNGATQYGLSGGNQDLSYAGTMGVTKGKWYFENYINEVVATYGARIYVGFHTFQQDYDNVQVGASTNGNALAVWQMDAGNYVAWNGGSRSITGSLGTVDSSGAGKFVGIALNLDDNQISFYYDGSAVTNGTNLSLYNMGSQTDDGIFAIPVVQTKGSIQTVNFGGYTGATISSAQSDANGYGTFEHAPPSGYYALCGKNLAEYGGTA